MKLFFKTRVQGHYESIMKRFDRDLFEALSPKSAKMEIVEFTGSEKGDRVHVRFTFPIKADWKSDIVEHGSNEKEAWFVDVGTTMPFGLALWHHRHVARYVDETTCEIVDDITFKGKNWLLSLMLYPIFYLGFSPRAGVYKSYFGRP